MSSTEILYSDQTGHGQTWVMVDRRPARVRGYDSDFDSDFMDYTTARGEDHFLRLGRANPRVGKLRHCAGCRQPLNSLDCPLSVEVLPSLCLLCEVINPPCGYAHEVLKYGMRVTP